MADGDEQTPKLPTIRVSDSLDKSKPGELVFVDNQGRVVGARGIRLRSIANVVTMGVLAGFGAGLMSSFFGPWAGIAYGTAMLGAVFYRQRGRRALGQALALAAGGQVEEAYAQLSALENKANMLGDRRRHLFDIQLANLDWRRGRPLDALARFERALASLHPKRRDANYWICTFERAQLLVALGRLEEARALRAELAHAPPGELFAMERMATDLLLAFYSASVAELPELQVLYDWAKATLRTNRFGLLAVLLGWAFEQLRDPEMAEHMLREAPARLEHAFLDRTVPAVYAWYTQRQADLAARDASDGKAEPP